MTDEIPEQILAHEFSEDFVIKMKNRMLASFFKYGKVADSKVNDRLASLQKRLDKYRETGNTEWLVDAANFAMIEYMLPVHSDAHFRATDSHESPGVVRVDGTASHGLNILTPEAAVEAVPAHLRREGD